jgi:hypothetical protein
MKNDRTPRTLAECDFSVGYPTVPRRRSVDVSSWVIFVMFLATLAMIFWGVI